MSPRETIQQRVDDVRAMMARYRITIKDVCERGDLPYDSVRINMRRYEVSQERMTAIETAALEIRDEIVKKKKAVKRVLNEY